MYLFQLRKGEAVHWFTRALTTVEELLIVLRNSDDEKGLIEMKGTPNLQCLVLNWAPAIY